MQNHANSAVPECRVPEVSYFDAADLLGEVFVDTVDMVCDVCFWKFPQNSTTLTPERNIVRIVCDERFFFKSVEYWTLISTI